MSGNGTCVSMALLFDVGGVCGGVVVHRGHFFTDSGRGIPSRPERELSSELHYSGFSRRGLFSKAIRLGLYTCILYVCIYTYIYIYICVCTEE